MVVTGIANGEDFTGVWTVHGEFGEPCFLFKLRIKIMENDGKCLIYSKKKLRKLQNNHFAIKSIYH